MPIEASRGLEEGGNCGAISLERVVIPSPRIVVNLPGTFEKLVCKGEPDQRLARFFSTNRQTDKHPVTLLYTIEYLSFDRKKCENKFKNVLFYFYTKFLFY